MTEYETRRAWLDVGRELRKKCRLILGLAALSVAVGCTVSPSSEKGQPASTEQSSTPFSEPNYGNQDLPDCRYDLDGDPETLSPGEAFIAAAEGAWVAPDGSQAYIAPILVKNLLPGETNESASLKPYHVNGGPFTGGTLPLYPIDPNYYRSFRWYGPRSDTHQFDTCYDDDPNVHRNPRVTTRVYVAPGQAELFIGQMAPYPSDQQTPETIAHKDLVGNEEASGLYVAGAAEVASAGIHRDRMSISPPFQGW